MGATQAGRAKAQLRVGACTRLSETYDAEIRAAGTAR